MFNQLVESTSGTNGKFKKSIYFGLTSLIYSALLLAIFVWSVFSFDLSAFGANDELAINSMVAPVEIPAKTPPPPPPASAPKQKLSARSNDRQQFDRIKNPVAPISTSTEPPQKISTVKSDATAIRVGVPYILSDKTVLAESGSLSREPSNNSSAEINIISKNADNEKETEPPPAPTPKPPAPLKKETIVSIGVVNGKAITLPKPPYPIPARAVHAAGEVQVQILIDEKGNVVSATAATGHPLLRAAAVTAAKQAKFTPTLLSHQPVKVTGVIIYNFKPQ